MLMVLRGLEQGAVAGTDLYCCMPCGLGLEEGARWVTF